MNERAPKRLVYMDHAATTPIDGRVAELIHHTQETVFGNPTAMYQLGREAASVLFDARSALADSLKVLPQEIIFTGSGTESVNLAILGAARANRDQGRHIIISAIEHKAVFAAIRVLESEGFTTTIVPVQHDGTIEIDSVISALQDDTILVSIMYANNEIGTIQPIDQLTKAIKAHTRNKPPLFHTDACQAVGLLPVYPKELGVDLLSLNGSKIYGPKGSGALWMRNDVSLHPLIVGGDQEYGLRAGTENVAFSLGLAEAVFRAVENQQTEYDRLLKLQSYFFRSLSAIHPQLQINGSLTSRLPNNVHVTLPHLEGESLVLLLDSYGVAAATGSACSALDLTPSHVLQAIGMEDDIIHGSVRFSMGRSTTSTDIDYTVNAFAKAIDHLQRITTPECIPHKTKRHLRL